MLARRLLLSQYGSITHTEHRHMILMKVYQVTLIKEHTGLKDVIEVIAADRLAAQEIANRVRFSPDYKIADCHARRLA
jgi:hypothetical protein